MYTIAELQIRSLALFCGDTKCPFVLMCFTAEWKSIIAL